MQIIDREPRQHQVQEQGIPKAELYPVAAELADTARTLLWTLPGGFGDQSKPIPDAKEWGEKKGTKTIPDVVTIGTDEFQASWSYPEEKSKGNYQSHRIIFKSGDKLLALAYGHEKRDGSKVGASILYHDKREHITNTKTAVSKAVIMLEELMKQLPDGEIPVLEDTNKLLSDNSQAA